MTKLIVSALFAIFMICSVVEAAKTTSGVAKIDAIAPHPY